jgi:hypothetical protein
MEDIWCPAAVALESLLVLATRMTRMAAAHGMGSQLHMVSEVTASWCGVLTVGVLEAWVEVREGWGAAWGGEVGLTVSG